MVTDGNYMFERRKVFLLDCIRWVKDFYRKISDSEESVEITYDSQLLRAPFADWLRMQRDRDMALQRTTAGVHKDDLQMMLNGQPFRNIASQGQRKSLLFALKLAEFTLLKENKGFAPLLLLDDIFEKLDEHRMHNLLDWVCVRNEGQIFLTDTHGSRIADHFEKLEVPYQLIQL